MIGEHCEAIESYKTALYHEGDVANSQLHFNLASAYSATRQYVLAADHYTRSIQSSSGQNSLAALLCLGEVYQEMMDYGRAEQAYRTMLTLDPTNSSALSALDNLRILVWTRTNASSAERIQ